jgi:murein DD-endopeptidase MepM/ murein hydrolase activator NlpD
LRPKDATGKEMKDEQSEREGDEATAVVPRFDTTAEQSARTVVPTQRAEHFWKRRARLKVILLVIPALALIGALVWYLSVSYRITPVEPIQTRPAANAEATPAPATTAAPAPTLAPPETPAPTTSPTPLVEASPPAAGQQPPGGPAPAPPASSAETQVRLVVPVAGVRPEDLRDTFTQSRSEGRSHDAIDIMAPRGTPVVAAADGRVVRLFQSVPGGITLYQLATDNRTILYYAHLDRYADNVTEGHFARQGETIGYVGDTGNAGPGNYHLHFSVSITADPKRWHGGANVNPYPLLTQK